MAWKCPTSPVAKKFKSQPSASNIMLTLFWHMEGAILVHFTPKGETINSQNNCNMLQMKQNWCSAKLVKDITKNLFSNRIKNL
jgi:hypothetical protein